MIMSSIKAEAALKSESEHHSHGHHHKKLGAANPTFKKLFNDGRPANLADEDTLSYDTLKLYGPAIRVALQNDIQTKMLPEMVGKDSSEAIEHLSELVGDMKATIYRSVAHMVMNETFVEKMASVMDKGTCEAVTSGQVKSALESAIDTELEKSLSSEIKHRLVPAMLDCVDSLTLKASADQTAQVEELRQALDSARQTISLLSNKCKSLEGRVRGLAQKQQFASSEINVKLAEAVKELRALGKDEDFARQFDTRALTPNLPSRSEAEITEQVLEQVRGQVIRPMLAQMRDLQEVIRVKSVCNGREDSAPSSPTLAGSTDAVRRQMKGLIDEGKWDEAFQAVVAYTLQVDEQNSDDVLQELLDKTSSQPEMWLSHTLPGTTDVPLSTRPHIKVDLIDALVLQLKAPRSDISVDVVDSKLDWLRELALSMNTSSIRGTPELIERLSRIVQQMKGLGEAPDSFVAVQNIRDSDTTAQKLLLSKLGLVIRCMEALIR